MTAVARLARFVVARGWDDLSDAARGELKIRVLDALGCALGALRAQVEEFGGRPLCTLIGGGATALDRAALLNGALVRYLDFNDSYFAPGETCHPSDNLAPVLAAAEYAHASGRWARSDALGRSCSMPRSACSPCSSSPRASQRQTVAALRRSSSNFNASAARSAASETTLQLSARPWLAS